MYGYYQPRQDERIWVQGETSAEAYLVAPGGFVRLWDANQPVFYERRADGSGKPLPMKAYKYEQIPTKSETETIEQANTYQETLNAILGRLEALEKGANHEPDADDTAV